MSQKEIVEIKKLLKLDKNELYARLGHELIGPNNILTNIKENEKLGESWFIRNKEKLKSKVCNNQVVLSAFKLKQNQTELQIALAILDLISNLIIGVSPVTVAVLIVKEGLNSFCKKEWEKK